MLVGWLYQLITLGPSVSPVAYSMWGQWLALVGRFYQSCSGLTRPNSFSLDLAARLDELRGAAFTATAAADLLALRSLRALDHQAAVGTNVLAHGPFTDFTAQLAASTALPLPGAPHRGPAGSP